MRTPTKKFDRHVPPVRPVRKRPHHKGPTQEEWDAFVQAMDAIPLTLNPTGPQLLEGELGLFDPKPPKSAGGAALGRVSTWQQLGEWNELWDVTDFAGFENANFRVAWTGDLPGSDPTQVPQQPGTSRAHLKFVYNNPPNAAQIAALGEPPSGSEIHRFRVWNGPTGGTATTQRGRLFRAVGPDDQVADHWILWSGYTPPGGTTNSELWVTPHKNASDTLGQFLSAAPPGSTYVGVSYQWTHMP